MITTVIFDFDGVFYNSPYYTWKSRCIYLKEKYGIELKIIPDQLGKSLQDQLAAINKEYDLSIGHDEFSEKTRAIHEKLMKGKARLNSGMEELIDDLIENNVKYCIASSNIKENIIKDLKMFGLKDKFKIIISSKDVEKHKPEPGLFLAAANRLSSKPEECVVIEDAMNGIKAARKAGMKIIALVTKVNTREELKGADLVVDSLEEVNYKKIKEL